MLHDIQFSNCQATDIRYEIIRIITFAKLLLIGGFMLEICIFYYRWVLQIESTAKWFNLATNPPAFGRVKGEKNEFHSV